MRSTSDLAALCGRRVGKSQSAGWVAAHHVVEGEGRTALCISPTQRQSGELFRLAKAAIVKAMPDASFPTDNRLINRAAQRLAAAEPAGRPRHGARAHGIAGAPGRDAEPAGRRARAVRLGATHAGDDRRQDDRAGHAARPQRACCSTSGKAASRWTGQACTCRARSARASRRRSWRASAGCWARRFSAASILPSSPRRLRACSITTCCKPRCCRTTSSSIKAAGQAYIRQRGARSGSAPCGRA